MLCNEFVTSWPVKPLSCGSNTLKVLSFLSQENLSGSWQVLMRCVASGLFLLAHGLLVLEHIAMGTALHGVAELFLAPWAVRHRAWDLIVIGLIFCVFDLWGTVRLTGLGIA